MKEEIVFEEEESTVRDYCKSQADVMLLGGELRGRREEVSKTLM